MTPRGRVAHRLVAALAALLLVAVGCSGSGEDGPSSGAGSDDNDRPADAREVIAADVRGDFGEDALSEDQARCFADRVVGALGDDEALALNDSDQTIEEATDEEREAVEAAFNDCFPGSLLADVLVPTFYEALGADGEPTDAVLDCVAEQVEGRVGTVLIEQSTAGSDSVASPAAVDALDPCIPDEVLTAPFVQAFEEGGATPEQAACAAAAVVDQLGLADLVELAGAGDLPAQATEVLGTATADCL